MDKLQTEYKRVSAAYIARYKKFVMVVAMTLIGLLTWSPAIAQGISEHSDLKYFEGEGFNNEKHRLDIVIPEGRPAIATMLWIHGGAWAFGDRKDDLELARAFAREGVAVATMSYRLSRGDWRGDQFPSTGVQHPEHIKDVARAFAWLHSNAATYKLDNKRLFVSGFSAGGHLSALLAMDARYLAAQNLSLSHVRGAIPVAGGYDLEDYYLAIEEGLGQDVAIGHVLGVFGPREGLADASPMTYLQGASIPMLVLTEGQTIEYTRVFDNAVSEGGKSALIQFSYYDEETHASLLASLSREDSPARREMLDFISSTVDEVE